MVNVDKYTIYGRYGIGSFQYFPILHLQKSLSYLEKGVFAGLLAMNIYEENVKIYQNISIEQVEPKPTKHSNKPMLG